ncbi:MAG: hypothetical protein WAU32_12600 [Thermoanaerobaculia bacterium]
MPVTYRIDPEHRRILTRCEGNATLFEVLAHFDELELDADFPSGADVLLDLTGMTSLPNIGQIRTAADRAGDAARKVRFGSVAIIVGSEAIFGMARVFETFTERHFTRTAVFRSREAAEAWLAKPSAH